jgi:hypothetical protein
MDMVDAVGGGATAKPTPSSPAHKKQCNTLSPLRSHLGSLTPNSTLTPGTERSLQQLQSIFADMPSPFKSE